MTKSLVGHIVIVRTCKCCSNLYLFGKLLGLETEESWTHRRKEEIQVSALGLSFSEAFLEAGPQFILQVSIVLRLGYVCE